MPHRMTKYQEKIFQLLIAGLTPKEIAQEVQRSESSVRMLILYAKRRLGARTLPQAIAYYAVATKCNKETESK
jgi:DNA-binding CsgD family transcriptional regulator